MNNSTGKICIVTGGAQGIGYHICSTLAAEGYAVVMVDCDQEALDEAAETLNAPDLLPWRADVTKEDEMKWLFASAEKNGWNLHGIVNNAGISRNTSVTQLTLDEWNLVLHTNLTSIFLTAKYGSPLMNRGCIVNISSTRALMSEPDTEAYSASKGGVTALTHALAVSLGPKIRVNAVSPGWIDVSRDKKTSLKRTEKITAEDHSQHPCGRVGRPQDAASMVGYLLSPAAEFITGENIVVDGGMTRKMIYI